MPDPDRLLRAWSIACAALCWKGDTKDADGLQGLADEFLNYINGVGEPPIPLHDKLEKGKLPKGKR